MSYYGLCAVLTYWRGHDQTQWLSRISRQTSEAALKDLSDAFRQFFRTQAGWPQYRKKGRGESFRFKDPRTIRLDEVNGRVHLQKIGWVRYRKSRDVDGEVRTATVKLEGDHWYICISTLRERPEGEHPSHSAVGVDLGVVRFATLSDGTVYGALNALRSKQKLLARRQRQLARKKKGSNNWKKQKKRISKLHRCIARTRKDFLHKVSTAISKSHATVVLEDLSVGNMTRAAQEKGVAAKSGLNKAILDQGWGMFRQMLEYKQEERGGEVVVVDPAHTSQRCAECEYVSAENRPSQARFRCQDCGHEDHADVNAAMNILAAGLAATARGGQPEVGAPAKREPARTEVAA